MNPTIRWATALAVLAVTLPAASQTDHVAEFTWSAAHFLVNANADSGVHVAIMRDTASRAAWFAATPAFQWYDSITAQLATPVIKSELAVWQPFGGSLHASTGHARVSVLWSIRAGERRYRISFDDGGMNDALTADVSPSQLAEFVAGVRIAAERSAANLAAAPPTIYNASQVTMPVRVNGSVPTPTFPPSLMNSHTGGSVTVQFVVDTTGKALMSTFKVIQTTDMKFADAVRRVIPFMTFYPAEINGRKVAQWVRQPFTFAVR